MPDKQPVLLFLPLPLFLLFTHFLDLAPHDAAALGSRACISFLFGICTSSGACLAPGGADAQFGGKGGDGMNAILSWGRLDNAVPPDFWVLPDGTGGLVAFFLN